ncbi:hypothetical protein G7068_16135 [Leucobacter viscericola]|uniref:Uncharacterized protein n=1 Tax=Leucobacter viscericola TaxID=2714935 RepID=A0A6G7XB18_9MICO|nr:hypothetical protein [Leucobacter viscericola]QIK61794.1 hypothetical protein G7068_00145 [Leucobacter viscericola]QIK64576.1 hypothetical protein G7068_16135 [Leucobacter viscericola]
MTISIKVDGTDVTREITSHSVSENATPVNVTEMSGGVSQMTLQLKGGKRARHMRRKEVELVDSGQGKTVGRVSSISDQELAATVTADSRMIAFVSERKLDPYVGNLSGYFTYLCSVVGITSGIVIDSSLSAIPVVATGWNGSVWDRIKQLCSAHRVEASLVSNNVVFRPIRGRVAQTHRDSARTVSVDDSNTAQRIKVHYLESAERRTDLAFPLGGWTEETRVFNVKAGETLEFSIDLKPASGEDGPGVSLQSIIQPTCVDFVGRDHVASSVYCVAGNDGKPITASQWLATGGNLQVEIGEDSQTLIIRVTGSSIEQYAPYRIAATAGTSSYYSSLRVRGTGIFYNRATIDMATGNSADDSPTEIGAEVENLMLVGYESAWRAAADALCSWTGPTMRLNVTTRGLNRKGDSGSAAYPTIGDFNNLYPFDTFQTFDSKWPVESIASLNSFLFSKVENEFENQAFGNIAGSRVLEGGFWARISSATISPATVSYQAEADTTIGDFNSHYGDMSIAYFNTLVGNWSVGDLGIEPLIPPT